MRWFCKFVYIMNRRISETNTFFYSGFFNHFHRNLWYAKLHFLVTHCSFLALLTQITRTLSWQVIVVTLLVRDFSLLVLWRVMVAKLMVFPHTYVPLLWVGRHRGNPGKQIWHVYFHLYSTLHMTSFIWERANMIYPDPWNLDHSVTT